MKLQILPQSHFLSLNRNSSAISPSSSSSIIFPSDFINSKFAAVPYSSALKFLPVSPKLDVISRTVSFGSAFPDHVGMARIGVGFEGSDFDRFAEVANELADAAGEVIRKYFRKSFDILDKDDLSPVTIADQAAEEAMVGIIQRNFPHHAIYGEENGWRCKEKTSDYVWVLDPIDGTKSFITGKPVFGTLIALCHKGTPVLGIVDQPILRERWIGLSGRITTLNGQEISTRRCGKLSQAYMYTTSPHLFEGEAEVAFTRVRDKVKVPLYGCDCYAYALLATGYVDLVIESGLKPYDILSLVPVIKGAGGIITDWKGHDIDWEASANSRATVFNVVAAGDKELHQQALDALEWN